tara:strand:- start:13 stop:990 length:978 start_codon:yes stop_codon:yes gene_type:complete
MDKVKTIAITGAAGNIAYSTIFRIASGDMLGSEQKINLNLIDIEQAMGALKGVKFELEDCAFPLIENITITSDLSVGFGDADYCLLIGAKPRSKGMERKDLLKDNGKIFAIQGKAINDSASKDTKVLVVGNPANTNALIAMSNAPDINPKQFTSMMRLDHDRTLAKLSNKYKTDIENIRKVVVWGNHSNTQVPDVTNSIVNGVNINDILEQDWYYKEFIPSIQKRGAEIIEARGLSSAASAANAAISHIKDWVFGSSEWVSMGQLSDANSYSISDNLIFSFPTTCAEGEYTRIENLDIHESLLQYIRKTEDELKSERDSVKDLIK